MIELASDPIEQAVIDLFEQENAIWVFDYNGNPKAPHVELTGGLCSDVYFDCPLVLSNPANAQGLASAIISEAKRQSVATPDWVVGSAYSAITFSYEVARQMGVRHGFAKKSVEHQGKMVWDGDIVIPKGAKVLRCEELITSAETVFEVRRAIKVGNPEPVNFLHNILAIVYRPQNFSASDPVIALLRRKANAWKWKDCPLCAAGSERLRPKQNWARLKGKA